MELTRNEKRLLNALGPLKAAGPDELAEKLDMTTDAVIQHALRLQERGLADVEMTVQSRYQLTPEGEEYAARGLPERQLLESFDDRIPLKELTSRALSSIAIGWMRKKGWITIRDGIVEKIGRAPEGEDERALHHPVPGEKGIAELLKRGLVKEETIATYRISLTPTGAEQV